MFIFPQKFDKQPYSLQSLQFLKEVVIFPLLWVLSFLRLLFRLLWLILLHWPFLDARGVVRVILGFFVLFIKIAGRCPILRLGHEGYRGHLHLNRSAFGKSCGRDWVRLSWLRVGSLCEQVGVLALRDHKVVVVFIPEQ